MIGSLLGCYVSRNIYRKVVKFNPVNVESKANPIVFNDNSKFFVQKMIILCVKIGSGSVYASNFGSVNIFLTTHDAELT